MEKLSWIQKLSNSLALLAGEEVRQEVMRGSEDIRSASTPKQKAEWIRGAMQRLDALIPDPQRRACILRNCCCDFQKRKDTARQLYLQAPNLDGFLQNLHVFGRIVREDDGRVYVVYPRCDCGWVRGTRMPISGTYCHCGAEYLSRLFSAALDRPVRVDLLQSVIQGAPECKFYVPLEE